MPENALKNSMKSSWTPTPAVFRRLVLAALLPFAAVVIARRSDPPSALEGDYAHYLLHAKAIAEGRSYTDIGYIYTRRNLVGPRLQPPGWPLVLAPFVAVFGTNSLVYRGLMAVLVATFGVIAGVYVARRFGAVAGIATVGFVPLALETQYATGSALSDPLFCLLVWLAFLVADSEAPPGWRRGTLLALLCAAALSVRIAAVALPPALLLYAVLRWRKESVKVVVPVAALLAAAGVAGVIALENVPFMDRTLESLLPDLQALRRLSTTYATAVASSTLYPLSSNGGNDFYHLLAAVPMVVGAFLFVRHQWKTPAAAYILVYSGVLLLSPVRDPRYAWPLYPLTAAVLSSGLLWLGYRFVRESARPVVPRFALASLALVALGASVQLSRVPARASLFSDPNTVSLFDWLKATSDTTAMRVVFTNPRVLTLETEIPAMGIPFGEPDEIVEEFGRKSITHVVVPRTNITRMAERNLGALVDRRPEQFPRVFANASHDVHVFVARPGHAPDSGTLRSSNGR